MKYIEIVINDLEDCLNTASVLVKNGYTVRMRRRRKENQKSGYDRILVITKEDS